MRKTGQISGSAQKCEKTQNSLGVIAAVQKLEDVKLERGNLVLRSVLRKRAWVRLGMHAKSVFDRRLK